MKPDRDYAAAVALPGGAANHGGRRGKLAVSVLLSFACLGACADTTADKLETAVRLVEVLEYGKLFDDAQAQCGSPGNTLYDPAVMLENNPAIFRGITRQSAYWPDIAAVYRRNQLRACAYLSGEDFSRFMAQQFAERTSLEDLRSALTYYSSPVGRRLTKVTLEVNSAYQVYSNQAMQKAVLEADKQTQQEVGAIIMRYLQDPK